MLLLLRRLISAQRPARRSDASCGQLGSGYAPRLALASCLMLYFLGVSAAGAADTFKDVMLTVDAAEHGGILHGYLEHRFHVANASQTRSHEVRLVMPNNSYDHGASIKRISRTVVVGPQSRSTISLLQPALGISGDNNVSVHVDGFYEGKMSYSLGSAYGYYGGNATPRILVSRSINAISMEQNITSNILGVATNVGKHGHSYSSRQQIVQIVRSELECAQWKENWLAYSSYDGVAVTEGDFNQMSSGAKSALWRYVECGGCLLVAGRVEVPATWSDRAMPSAQTRYGQLEGRYVGFGQCLWVRDTSIEKLTRPQIDFLRTIWNASRSRWTDLPGAEDANKTFPVTEDISLPIRGLFIIIMVFAFVIGPVNLFILHRINRPILALLTIPIISLITAGIVIAYMLLSEGVTATIRIEGLTLLDQTGHRATTLGTAGYYSPLTPARGLHFGYDTELTHLTGDSRRHSYRAGVSRVLDWTRDQHLASGWISARVPSHFLIRKTERRRERLEIGAAEGGGISVVNGLGVAIERLWVADGTGNVFESVMELPAGKNAVLPPHPKGLRVSAGADALSGVCAKANWQVEWFSPTNSPTQLLAPGTYLAVLKSSPFIERGLEGKADEKLRSVVLGIWEQK